MSLKKQLIKNLPQRLQTLRRDMPELADKFQNIMKVEDWEVRYAALKEFKGYIQKLVPSETDKLFWATEKLQQRAKLAEDAIKALQRVKRGEQLPTGTINAIAKILPEAKGKLTQVSKYNLDDLVQTGAEAGKFPIELPIGPAYGKLKQAQNLLPIKEAQLAADPKNAKLFREVQRLRRVIGFSKYRIAKGEPIEFAKAPISILKGKHYDAINELLDVVRGAPVKAKTATGKVVTKYEGGLLSKFRAEATKAANLRKQVSDNAKKLHWGEVELPMQPAFAGRILIGKDAQKVAQILKPAMPSGLGKALEAGNVPNAVGRYFALAGDASLFTIQLILAPFFQPKAFLQGIAGFSKAFFIPEFHANLFAKHADTIINHPGLHLTRSLGTEFIPKGITKIPILKQLARPLKPFMRAFEAGLDAAGIHMAESLDTIAMGYKGAAKWRSGTAAYRTSQVDAFINEFRGVISANRLGIGSTQQEIERLLLLAPMYFRAVAATLTDAFRGNIRGYLARRALIKGAAGMNAMAVAVTIARSDNKDNEKELAKEIAEHLDPRSAKFFTWEVAGQNVGPGSKFRSILKLIGESVENPKRLTEMSMRNPALSFVYGNLSPVLRTGFDLIAGRQPFTGDPTREGAFSVTKTVIGRNMLPIWLQSVIWEGGDSDIRGKAIKGAIEFSGGRTYPETPYQKMEKKRNELALAKYGMLWEELAEPETIVGKKTPGEFAQRELERTNPELAELTRLSRERSVLMATGKETVWNDFNTQGQNIEGKFQKTIVTKSKEFLKIGDGSKYRDEINVAARIRSHDYDIRKYNPDFTLVKDYFDEPLTEEEKAQIHPLDLARREYYDMMFAPGMFDEFDNYDFDEADRREDEFIAKYGQEAFDYVQKFLNLKLTDPIYIALKNDRKLLTPYWELEPAITAKADFERTLKEKRILTNARKKMRTQYPEIDAALNLWGYASTVKTDVAHKLLEKKADALGVDKTRIPALRKQKEIKDILSATRTSTGITPTMKFGLQSSREAKQTKFGR